ncbi:MAG: hypothetical protein N3A02_04570 [Rectinema sp.]|nr:hypothetical protein [Rectinema sp.]
MQKTKILMLMIEVGLGHKIPAISVQESLEEKYPGRFDISIIDFARECGAKEADKQLKTGWDIALTFPLLARIGYLFIEMNRKNFDYIEILYKDFIIKGMNYLKINTPEVVFATHPLCLYIASKAKKLYSLKYTIISYVVDPFDGYSLWANPDSDFFLVASDQSKERLMSNGVDGGKIIKTGYPVRKSFFNITKTKETIIRELGLNENYPILLVTGGGQGISKAYLFIRMIKQMNLPINIIAVAGKNERRMQSLLKLQKIQNNTKLVVFGYITNMNEMIAASDLIAGKAGASTFMESIFMNKPMIFTEWAAFNDWYIINFALESNIGWYAPNIVSFMQTLEKILHNPNLLQEYSLRIKGLRCFNLSDATADVLARLCCNS